ncbi:ABC transporter permease [Undibacterium seohonense]|uniref:ABC transporter permease n=1 Tax=Undibacterium seohonense TaxID=1344950 RepID=A0ABR6X8E9_9BURK|nr:ABC transporter permease [Undibacterium seohonense]MBC3808604.1 ABC transporter permease [Undibacterium seohonense]
MTTWNIAVFEFKRYFKWKQEIISIVLMLVGMGFSFVWPHVKGFLDKDYQVAVIGVSHLPKLEGFQFSEISPDTKSQVMKNIGDSWHAVIEIDNGQVQLTLKEKASWQAKLKANLQSWQQERQIAQLPLTAQQRQQITQLPEIKTVMLTPEKDDKDEKGRALLSGALLFLLIMGIFSGFGYLFTGITSEKQNRVTEQLLTLITPSQWIQGKILGISLFCLKTMLTYGILFFAVIQGAAVIAGKPDVSIPVTAFQLLSTLLFVILGLLLVNSFMAAFAATIDDPNHSSRSIMMFLPALPVGLAYSGIDNAEGMMMQVLSVFPLTSFAAMPLRMAHTEVPMWQWLLAVSLLLACLWWFKSAATRVFTLGIRMYGKEPSWKQLLETFLFPVKH